jgi:predicted RNA-binding protein with PUA-like domain
MNYWLLKTEPEEYSFDDLVQDGNAVWDGIRNYQARNNLKLMKKGDKVFIYHTGDEKQIVGLAEVVKEHYADPLDKTNTWCIVQIKALEKLKKPITLEMIKNEKSLKGLQLLKQSRLSVVPLTKKEFNRILLL